MIRQFNLEGEPPTIETSQEDLSGIWFQGYAIAGFRLSNGIRKVDFRIGSESLDSCEFVFLETMEDFSAMPTDRLWVVGRWLKSYQVREYGSNRMMAIESLVRLPIDPSNAL